MNHATETTDEIRELEEILDSALLPEVRYSVLMRGNQKVARVELKPPAKYFNPKGRVFSLNMTYPVDRGEPLGEFAIRRIGLDYPALLCDRALAESVREDAELQLQKSLL